LRSPDRPGRRFYYGEGADRPTTTGWYAVRHVIRNSPHYEERITLWQADSFDDAVERAQEGAQAYVSGWSEESGVRPLDLFQAYFLHDELGDGAEIFSLIRRSELEPDEYVRRFFATGEELQTDSVQTRPPP
jgi:hypothetical protein